MKAFAWIPLLVCLVSAEELATDYSGKEARRVEVRTEIELETTTTVRGGDDSGRGAMPPRSSSVTLHEVFVDRVVEHAENRPVKVERAFEAVSGKAEVSMGEQSREAEFGTPLAGVTLAIARGESGEIDVSVEDGEAPDDEAALAHHRPELFLDGLLPASKVEVDATWDLDGEVLARALRLDVQAGMYAPPEPEPAAEGGRGRRGGTPGGELAVLRALEWKGKATLVALEEGDEGGRVARIRLEIEGAGEIEEPARSGGGRMLAPAAVLATSAQARLAGELVYSLAAKRPAQLDLEGSLTIESTRERERDGQTLQIETKSEGDLAFRVEVGAEK